MSSSHRKWFFIIVLTVVTLTRYSWAVPAVGQKIMISCGSSHALAVGQKIFSLGGNVVDVAVAMELAMAVTNPYYASLGGGGFAMIKMNGNVDALDFRETAPQGTSPSYFSEPSRSSSTGGPSIGVPGVPAGIWALHKKYGKLHWSQLFHHPIELAEKGYPVSGEWHRAVVNEMKRFNPAARGVFLKTDGSSYLPGDKLVQKGLAKILKEMRNRGPISFYQGQGARDIVAAVSKAGGIISLEDLKNYKVRWLSPMTTMFQGHKIYLMPPPSSGGVILKSAFTLVELLELKSKAPLSVDEFHLMAEILNRSFRGRDQLADPDFSQNPVNELTSTSHLKKMAESIQLRKVVTLPSLSEAEIVESRETSHFSVIDGAGNAVGFTITLNGNWGSGVATDQYGLILNNEMDDFTTRVGEPNQFGLVQGPQNKVEPGKRPLSSMSPTIVEKEGVTQLVLGGRGGGRIISGVFQTVYRKLMSGMDLDQAVQAPRIHNQFLPPKLFFDPFRFSPEVLQGLKDRGHKLEEGAIASVYAVGRTSSGLLEGVYDSRSEGAAGGL